ncbi:MAG: hypothetical protein GOV15_02560, partial [Candidatus Diapherotrites archaeon]|nr:hypothetical protein [Candidatus Diapherotrites archaeon]
YAFQYKNVDELHILVNRILLDLAAWGFIEINEEYLTPTRVGMRVSELYVDPAAAFDLISELKKIDEEPFKELGFIYAFTSNSEMSPFLNVSRTNESDVWEQAHSHSDELYVDPVTIGFGDYHFLSKFNLSLLIRAWLHERTEDDLLNIFNVAPGILRSKLTNLDWLVYSGSELSKLLKLKNAQMQCNKLRMRLKYGVTEDLLALVALRNIGRSRARRLFNSNIKSPSELKRADPEMLAKLIGRKTSEKILTELHDRTMSKPVVVEIN